MKKKSFFLCKLTKILIISHFLKIFIKKKRFFIYIPTFDFLHIVTHYNF